MPYTCINDFTPGTLEGTTFSHFTSGHSTWYLSENSLVKTLRTTYNILILHNQSYHNIPDLFVYIPNSCIYYTKIKYNVIYLYQGFVFSMTSPSCVTSSCWSLASLCSIRTKRRQEYTEMKNPILIHSFLGLTYL